MDRIGAIEILALARRRSIQSGKTIGVLLTHDEVTAISAELLGVTLDEPEIGDSTDPGAPPEYIGKDDGPIGFGTNSDDALADNTGD